MFLKQFFSLKYRQKCWIKQFSHKSYAIIFQICHNAVHTEKLRKSIFHYNYIRVQNTSSAIVHGCLQINERGT